MKKEKKRKETFGSVVLMNSIRFSVYIGFLNHFCTVLTCKSLQKHNSPQYTVLSGNSSVSLNANLPVEVPIRILWSLLLRKLQRKLTMHFPLRERAPGFSVCAALACHDVLEVVQGIYRGKKCAFCSHLPLRRGI